MNKIENMLQNLTESEREAIGRFISGDPAENPWVDGKPPQEKVSVVEYRELWPRLFQSLKKEIITEPGSLILNIEHVGSTAVKGLAAKPVIDIDILVDDPDDESCYVPLLTELGYRLTIREVSWYQHRMLRLEEPRVNLHVFPPNCPEYIRHILFCHWLNTHKDDRQKYGEIKNVAKEKVSSVSEYNQKKESVIRKIYQKIFQHYGI